MKSQSQYFVSVIALSTVVWYGTVSISKYLSTEFDRQAHGHTQGQTQATSANASSRQSRASAQNNSPHEADSKQAALPPELQALKSEADKNPNNSELQLQFGAALAQEGRMTGSGGLLMDAAQVIGKLVEREPKNPEALRELGNLCIDGGLFDRAITYFNRYIEIKPDDPMGHVNLALALVQSNKVTEAISKLEDVSTKYPKLFAPKLALALAYRQNQDLEKARTVALAAKALASDDMGKQTVDQFIEHLNDPAPEQVAEAQTESNAGAQVQDSALVSPAESVVDFFKNHPIIGPKIGRITWPQKDLCVIALKNFPAEQMPEFAKQSLIRRAQETLKAIPEQVEVSLQDSETKQEYFKFPVGKNTR